MAWPMSSNTPLTQTSTNTLKHIMLVISIANHTLTWPILVSRGKLHLFWTNNIRTNAKLILWQRTRTDIWSRKPSITRAIWLVLSPPCLNTYGILTYTYQKAYFFQFKLSVKGHRFVLIVNLFHDDDGRRGLTQCGNPAAPVSSHYKSVGTWDYLELGTLKPLYYIIAVKIHQALLARCTC